MGYKGRVHFHIVSCINSKLAEIDRSLPRQELFVQIAQLIDRAIHSGYRLYPGNYVAADWLNGEKHFTAHYTEADKQKFENYIQQQLARIDLPDKDETFLRTKMLQMYANPLRNYLYAQKHD